MGLILLAVLAILVVLPLIQIVIGASTFGPNDVRLVPGAKPGAWTIYHWKRIAASRLTQVLLVKPLLNSLSIALGVVVIALPLGSLIAWLVVRTDLPLKRLISNISVIPYVMPSWVMALAWFTVFKNRTDRGDPQLLAGHGDPYPQLARLWLYPDHSRAHYSLLPLRIYPRFGGARNVGQSVSGHRPCARCLTREGVAEDHLPIDASCNWLCVCPDVQ